MEKAQPAEEIPVTTTRPEKPRSSMSNMKNFIAKSKMYTDMIALPPAILHIFVSKIIVHKQETKYSKDVPQEVHIRFRYFDLNDMDVSFYDEKQIRQPAQMHCLPDPKDTVRRYPCQEYPMAHRF